MVNHDSLLNALMNEFWSCTDNFKCFLIALFDVYIIA